MNQDFQIKKVLASLTEARDVAAWNYRLDKKLHNYDAADRWSATLGHIENAIERLAA